MITNFLIHLLIPNHSSFLPFFLPLQGPRVPAAPYGTGAGEGHGHEGQGEGEGGAGGTKEQDHGRGTRQPRCCIPKGGWIKVEGGGMWMKVIKIGEERMIKMGEGREVKIGIGRE